MASLSRLHFITFPPPLHHGLPLHGSPTLSSSVVGTSSTIRSTTNRRLLTPPLQHRAHITLSRPHALPSLTWTCPLASPNSPVNSKRQRKARERERESRVSSSICKVLEQCAKRKCVEARACKRGRTTVVLELKSPVYPSRLSSATYLLKARTQLVKQHLPQTQLANSLSGSPLRRNASPKKTLRNQHRRRTPRER